MAVYPKGNKFMASVGAGADRIRKTFPTEDLANQWEAEQNAIRDAAKAVPEVSQAPAAPTCWTLQQAFDHAYRHQWKGKGGERKAVLNAQQALAFFGPNRPVSEIVANEVMEWMEELQEVGNSGATCNKKLSALRVMLTSAMDYGNLAALPRVKRYKESQHRIRFYSTEEEADMLRVTRHAGLLDLHEFIKVGLDTGFRRTELLRLTVSDERNGFLMVHAGETKGGSARSVPCSARVAALIQARKAAGETRLFPGLTNSSLRKQWDDMRALLRKADDPGYIVHVLRHTCCTRLVAGGMDLKAVQDWMGHANIQTTMRYAHMNPSRLLAGAGIMDRQAAALETA